MENEYASRKDVLRAMKQFARGERQPGRGEVRSSYVYGPDGRKFPAKHIWGLATGLPKFQTNTATKELRELGFIAISENDKPQTSNLDESIQKMVSSIISTAENSGKTLKQGESKIKYLELSKDELESHLNELIELQNGRCALSGLELNLSTSSGDDQLRPSADRIDSYGHYVMGNIQVVCKFINFWKGSQENDEFIRLLETVKSK